MSFDLHFQPCRFDGTTEKRLNPFTKQLQDIPRNEPLSDGEVAAVVAVLERAGAKGPVDGCYSVRFEDGGGRADLLAENLAHGCLVAIAGAGVTLPLARLLFDVLVAGNWVLLGEEDVVLAPSLTCVRGAPAAFGEIVVVKSADDVGAVLSGGADEWKKYRARVGP